MPYDHSEQKAIIEAASKSSDITESKLRSLRYGLDPAILPVFDQRMSAAELKGRLNEYEDVLVVVRFFVQKLLNSLKGNPILIVVTDEKGTVLEMDGDDTIKQTVNQLGITTGVRFTEDCCGTNVINLSLLFGSSVALIGDDHFHHYLHTSACYAVPFHYKDLDDYQLGSISIMTSIDMANPFYLNMLEMAVDSIERELLLVKQNHRLNLFNQIMLNSNHSGIIVTDKDGTITEINDIAAQLTGLGKGLRRTQIITKFKPIGQYISDVIQKGSKYENIQLMFDRKNTFFKFVCLLDAMPIYDEHYRITGAYAQFRDVTQLYEAEEKYNHLAYHDDLTGLPNRRYFYKQINEWLETAKQQDLSTFSILYVDLDRFKLVNDSLGHKNGDLLLMEVAERLRMSLTPNGLLTRMSGDEFIIMIPSGSESQDAVKIADRIMKNFQPSFTIDNQEFHITASIGIAYYPEDGVHSESLLVHADRALYKAKESGRNHYLLYEPSMDQSSHERMAKENALRKAVERNEWVLHYQPQIHVESGDVIGVEALIRWVDAEGRSIPPKDFIPLAEETGIIVPIGEWVLKEACMQNKRWQDAGYPRMRVAVNLSAAQFSKSNFTQSIEEVLKATGLDPECLELEITETMTTDVEKTRYILNELNRIGVQISMDDFGTGYSSLNYLKNFPIHRLKIDRSFVKDITTEESDARIVGVIVSMAHHLGLDVVAEGVETEEQVEFLRQQGCDAIQGYYYSSPLTAEQFEKKYLQSNSIRKMGAIE
ncbi:EAL domain-containing protein [Paenibacillus filicis]|uniref:EAL domain-containing protein n=1 Tax=Paenibacillus gyeongsangnamensis TaxID=3388067 RepID=A0ABT4Q552_9BACL|nr:EAL domain-containing protein [Paenibacillus filicis]MCZ8511949.1 EAL domain-containing protein [Paenibacillus filicis]